MKKKAEGSSTGAIVAIILAIFVVIFGISFVKRIGTSGQIIDDSTYKFLPEHLQKCREYSERSDHDNDGFPDFCDNCPLINNAQTEDKDEDLFPKGCCGNDGTKSYMVNDQYKEPGWCGGDKIEDDNNPKKYPKYDVSLSIR